MIIRKHPNILALLFTIRGSIVPRIILTLLTLVFFTSFLVLMHHQKMFVLPELSLTPFSLLGVSLSLFLGFRNNAAYERWWEARKQWGEMVHEIRSLARSSETLLDLAAEHKTAGELRKQLLSWTAAHCHALRASLRHEDCREDLLQWIDKDSLDHCFSHTNPADYCLRRAGRLVGTLYRRGDIDSIGLRILDEHLSRLSGVQAACERINNTPLPFAFTLLTRRTAYLYCYTLPFALIPVLGLYSVLFTLMVAYTFLGLDVLSQELEGPFGREANDLPLDSLCRINEISIAESLGQQPPKLLQPKNYELQ